MMRPVHLRMARAALGWTLKDLAERAKVNLNTISRFEAGSEVLSGTIERIEIVLKAEGVVFIDADGEMGLGVRLNTGVQTGTHVAAVENNAKRESRNLKR